MSRSDLRSIFRVMALVGALSLSAVAATATDFGPRFWEHWGDGRAELASYDLQIERYGETRHGTAVTIFVTETFSNELRVKADPGRHPASDEFPVMKLNLIQDFRTGIYDYNLMASVFVALAAVNGRPAGSPTKVSFSSQEWCGHVWHQLLFDEGSIREQSFSYFDSEADRSGGLEYPAGGVAEDALLLWARGLAAPDVMPGAPVRVPILRSLQDARLGHRDLEWGIVQLSVSETVETTVVPAGEFRTREHTAVVENGPTWTFWVHDEFPYRVVRWTNSDGTAAELRGVDRMAYWELNHEGGERALERIGLGAQ